MADETVRRPRWGHRTSLFQWRQPALYLYAGLMLLTGMFTILTQAAFQQISPSGWVLSWFLLLVYAIPVFLLVYWLDLYEREPLSLVFGALLWGGVAATTLAFLANTGWAIALGNAFGPEVVAEWGAALTAPWTEEILKALGVVLIYLIARSEIDDVLDGFVYGAMVGLGFTLVEDVFYFMGQFGGQTEGILLGFFVRVIASGLYGHVLYSGLAGMGIAYFVSRRAEASLGKRLLVGAGLFLTAVFGHFLWNSPLLDFFPDLPLEGSDFLQVIGATAVKGLPLLLFVAAMVRLAHRREHRWLEAALTGEVGREGLTRNEWEVLRAPRHRRAAVKAMRRRAGPQAGTALKRLHRQQLNLAMIRTRVTEDEDPDLGRQRAYCAALRQALEAVPGAVVVEARP
ncbi:MAG TPA: PrsW family intramembrane metalloprotease [Actinomycetota bacterium]